MLTRSYFFFFLLLQIQVWLCVQKSRESTAITSTPTSQATWRTVSDLSALCSEGSAKEALSFCSYLCLFVFTSAGEYEESQSPFTHWTLRRLPVTSDSNTGHEGQSLWIKILEYLLYTKKNTLNVTFMDLLWNKASCSNKLSRSTGLMPVLCVFATRCRYFTKSGSYEKVRLFANTTHRIYLYIHHVKTNKTNKVTSFYSLCLCREAATCRRSQALLLLTSTTLTTCFCCGFFF